MNSNIINLVSVMDIPYANTFKKNAVGGLLTMKEQNQTLSNIDKEMLQNKLYKYYLDMLNSDDQVIEARLYDLIEINLLLPHGYCDNIEYDEIMTLISLLVNKLLNEQMSDSKTKLLQVIATMSNMQCANLLMQLDHNAIK